MRRMPRLRLLLVTALVLGAACSARSTNAGNTWTPAFTLSAKGPSGEPVGDSFHIDRDAILATADGGQTWQEQFSRPSPAG